MDNMEHTKPVSVIRKETDVVIMISIGEFETENEDQQMIVDDLENSNGWLLQRVRLPADGGKKFCEQFKKHKAMTCGDGLYKQGRATGGSLSFDRDTMQVGRRVDNEIPIDPIDGSVYAGELGGIGEEIIAATNMLCRQTI